MPNYLSRMKPNGANGTEYKLKDEELREVVQTIQDEVAGTKTATGNPITLTDGSETYAEGLSVELEPKQDLHGYDFPWVGGAGKNKLPMTVAGIKAANTSGIWTGNTYNQNEGLIYTILTDDYGNVTGININGTSTLVSYFYLAKNYTMKAGSYILNGGISANIRVYDDGSISSEGGDASFTLNSDTTKSWLIRVANGATANNVKVLPMIRLSTETDPTFAPYSNICPISGYEGVEVEDVGKNRMDFAGFLTASNQSFTETDSTFSIPLITNEVLGWYEFSDNDVQVVCSIDDITGSVNNPRIEFRQNGSLAGIKVDSSNKQITVTCSAFRMNYSTSGSCTVVKPMIRLATDTDATFEPYHSSNATIQFGQTVYGGSVDVTDGGTSDEIAFIKDTHITNISEGVDGNADWLNVVFTTDINILLSDTVAHRQELAARSMSNYSGNWEYANVNGHVHFYNGSRSILAFYPKSVFPTLSDFITYYASNKAEFAIPYFTKSVVDTPKTELKLLQDTNNLTTNGTTITLDYIPNNSIGDAVKASEEYTDRAVERVAPKETLIDTWMISEESDTISVDLTAYDCNFFLFEYVFHNKKGTTLIPRPQGSFSVSVVTYYNGSAYCIELDYNPTTKVLSYTSNLTSEFGVLGIYTI